MIKTERLVPQVYYDRSRDFQALGRVCDFLFNYIKTGTNAIENNILSPTFDIGLIDLLTSTLGFKKAHEYNAQQLLAFCTAFPLILRNKGNLSSIRQLLTLIANVQNISEEIFVDISDYVLQVFVPETLSDLALFEDVLDYILPAGISYRIVNSSFWRTSAEDTLEFTSGLRNTESTKDVVKSIVAPLWNPGTSQEAQGDEMPLPKPSDSKEARIDNATVIAWQSLQPESGE